MNTFQSSLNSRQLTVDGRQLAVGRRLKASDRTNQNSGFFKSEHRIQDPKPVIPTCKETHDRKRRRYNPLVFAMVFAVANLFLVKTVSGQITQRGSATKADIDGTSVTINKPTGVVQYDVLIANIEQQGNIITDPSCTDWNLIDGAVIDAGGKKRYQAVLYKVAGASEPSSYSFSLGTGVAGGSIAIIAFYRIDATGGYLVGGSPGGPFDVAPGTINAPQDDGTTATATAITTNTANAAVIMLASMMDGTNNAAFSGWTTTSPGSLTELYDYNGDTESIGAAWATLVTAGSTGNGAVTLSAKKKWGAILLALKPSTATKLVYTTVPSTGTAGTPFSVTVQSQDVYGNPVYVTSNTTITLSVATGGGTLSGTLTGIISSGSNSVTISTPVYSKADVMTLTATATAGMTGLTPVTSGNITFSAGPLDHFSLSLASPQCNGSGFRGTNTLTALDGNNNVVTTFNASADQVTITVNSPLSGTISGLSGGNKLSGGSDFVSGVANLTSLGLTYTGTAASGTFTATSGSGKTGSSGSVMVTATGTWLGTTSTAWNVASNWCGGLPIASTNVTIPSGLALYPHVTASGAVCNGLTIQSGASVTIDAGGQLTVSGNIDNQAGYTGLVIKSESKDPNGTGSLLHTFADAGLNPPVPASMERHMTGVVNSDRQWHLIASPMKAQGVRDFLDLNQNVHRYGTTNIGYPLSPYKESTNTWSYYFDNTIFKNDPTYGTTIFTPGQGMQVFLADPTTVPPYSSANYSGKLFFTGELSNGDIPMTVKRESTSGKAGWNLLGNPYPSGLMVNSFLATNASLLESGYPIYVGNVVTRRYNAKSIADSWELPPGQGFFIKYLGTGSPVSFTNAMRSTTMSEFKAARKPWPKIELVAEIGGNTRNTRIYYIPGMTTGIDNGFDGVSYYNGSTAFEIFTELIPGGDLDLEVQCLPDKEYKTLVVPVGLNASAGSTVTISASVTGFPAKTPVYLEDRLTHVFTQLDKPGSFYSILLTTGNQGTGRFYLHTAKPKSGMAAEDDLPEPDSDITDDLTIIPMPQYQYIRIIGDVSLPSKATVYDLTGRMIVSQSLTGLIENEIRVNHMNNGVYLIVIENAGKVERRKIRWIE